MVAGLNSSRVISSRLTTRGFGTRMFAVSGVDVLERKVAAEAAAHGAHRRTAKIVEGAVERSRVTDRRVEVRRDVLRRRHRRLFGVVQVLLAQILAHLDEA